MLTRHDTAYDGWSRLVAQVLRDSYAVNLYGTPDRIDGCGVCYRAGLTVSDTVRVIRDLAREEARRACGLRR